MNLNKAKTSSNLFFKNLLAYVIVIPMTSVLTRLYEPSQFGAPYLMIFSSSFLGVLFTGRLELVISLVKNNCSLNNLAKQLLCFTCFFCFSTYMYFFYVDEISKKF